MKNQLDKNRYNPFQVTESLQDPFENFFHTLFGTNPSHEVMKTDLYEADNAYHFDVDMPGFDKSELNLQLEDGNLTVSAQHADSAQQDGYVRRERQSTCSRTYYVGDVDGSKISATYQNGTLHVDVPKQDPKDKGLQIPIK